MSSMRNAIQRRNHKERAQPAQREKWGILEKHKDYALRAKDYNEKKKRLKGLREKAAERNPDEFSYGMLSSKTDRYGRKIQDRGNPSLSQDAIKLLKTQDAGYLKTMIQQTRRMREKMEQQYRLLSGGNVQVLGGGNGVKNDQHVIFVDTPEAQKSFDVTQGNRNILPTAEDGLERFASEDGSLDPQGKKQMDPRKIMRQKEQELLVLKQDRAVRKLRKRREDTRQSRLNALKVRERDLLAAEQQIDHQRARLSNSVGGVNKAGVRWKVRERKR
ncbi:MAG: hypothetical protein Q9201_001433 [Fulgogasparrea decipioides]